MEEEHPGVMVGSGASWESGFCMIPVAAGSWKPPPGTLMEDSVTPETFARRKDTYFVRTRREISFRDW